MWKGLQSRFTQLVEKLDGEEDSEEEEEKPLPPILSHSTIATTKALREHSGIERGAHTSFMDRPAADASTSISIQSNQKSFEPSCTPSRLGLSGDSGGRSLASAAGSGGSSKGLAMDGNTNGRKPFDEGSAVPPWPEKETPVLLSTRSTAKGVEKSEPFARIMPQNEEPRISSQDTDSPNIPCPLRDFEPTNTQDRAPEGECDIVATTYLYDESSAEASNSLGEEALEKFPTSRGLNSDHPSLVPDLINKAEANDDAVDKEECMPDHPEPSLPIDIPSMKMLHEAHVSPPTLKTDSGREQLEEQWETEEEGEILRRELNGNDSDDSSNAEKAKTQNQGEEEALTVQVETLQRLLREEKVYWTSRLDACELQIAEKKREIFERDEELEERRKAEKALQTALDAAKREFQELESEVQKRNTASASVQCEKRVDALTTMTKQLERQIRVYEEEMDAISSTLNAALQAAGIESPEADDLKLSELAIFFSQEFLQLAEMTASAEVVQREWEKTYQKAQEVNTSLQQQLHEAWATVGELRESLSVKGEGESKLEAQVHEGQRRCEGLQSQLAELTRQLQRAENSRLRREMETPEKNHHEAEVVALQTHIDELQELLRQKEEEAAVAITSVQNLQHVLDHFNANRERDIAARTADLQQEIDNLRHKLEDTSEADAKQRQALHALQQSFEVQLEEKKKEISSLHAKLLELRRQRFPENPGSVVLSTSGVETAAADTALVDKELLSQMVATFIHAFVERRRETPEILKVLSGMLSWDAEMQERVGLLPGPSNPKPPGGEEGSSGGRLSRWKQRLSMGRQTSLSQPAGTPSSSGLRPPLRPSGGEPRQGSLAAMWVDFLLKESEGPQNEVNRITRDHGQEDERLDLAVTNSGGATPLRTGVGTVRGESPLPRPFPSP